MFEKDDGMAPEKKLLLSTLLEKRPLAPVEEGLWYRFFQPVPGKWYQWLGSSAPGKRTGA